MKASCLFVGLIFIFSTLNINAQTGEVVNISTVPAKQTMNGMTRTKPNTISGVDYVTGDSVIFAEDFEDVTIGSTAPSFKTNGTAVIVAIGNKNGKWLALAANSTYKFSKQVSYPKHFTVEFDLLALAGNIQDIYPVTFGFAKDNNVNGYSAAEGTSVDLKPYAEDKDSTFTEKFFGTRFGLPSGSHRAVHISIIVNNERMIVYLNKDKFADTQILSSIVAKNFYISGPAQYHNVYKVLVSNFRIAGFKHDN